MIDGEIARDRIDRLIPRRTDDTDARRYVCGDCGQLLEGARRASNHAIFTGHVIQQEIAR